MPDDDREVTYTYHRPISITVTKVDKMPSMRDLPQETLMTANLRLPLGVQRKIYDMLKANLEREKPDQIIALTIKGVS